MYKNFFTNLRLCQCDYTSCPYFNPDLDCCETDSSIGMCYMKYPEYLNLLRQPRAAEHTIRSTV